MATFEPSDPSQCVSEWLVYESDKSSDTITIKRVSGFLRPEAYRVEMRGYAYNKQGEWVYMPLPSSRTPAFLRSVNHPTFAAAWKAAMKAREAVKAEATP